jgi:hypothetical protein
MSSVDRSIRQVGCMIQLQLLKQTFQRAKNTGNGDIQNRLLLTFPEMKRRHYISSLISDLLPLVENVADGPGDQPRAVQQPTRTGRTHPEHLPYVDMLKSFLKRILRANFVCRSTLRMPKAVKGLNCKRPIKCLASSKIQN